jgi:prophage regulatory protein
MQIQGADSRQIAPFNFLRSPQVRDIIVSRIKVKARCFGFWSDYKLYGAYTMKDEFILIDLKEVIRVTRLSKSTVYRRMNEGCFPKHLNLGGNCRRWLAKDIQKWIISLGS